MFRYLIYLVAAFSLCATLRAQNTPQADCPNIKIVEPPGVAMFGNTVDFRIEPDLQNLNNVQIDWKVSTGTIEKGLGTSSIAVRSAPEAKIHVIVAQAIIKGLPKECKSVYEGSAVVGCCIDPVIMDEFGKLSSTDQKGRLDNALQELRNNPNNTGLFILRSNKGYTAKQLLKRVKFIKDFILDYRNFPANRIIIASDPNPYFEDAVIIYRMPPQIEARLYCPECRFH
jgi:hypothetical protein